MDCTKLEDISQAFQKLLKEDAETAMGIVNKFLPKYPKYDGCDLHAVYDIMHSNDTSLSTQICEEMKAIELAKLEPVETNIVEREQVLA